MDIHRLSLRGKPARPARGSLVGLAAAVVVATTLASAATALAASVATHVLEHDAGVGGSCVATNLGTKAVEIQVKVFRNGELQSDFTVKTAPDSTNGFVLPAGAGQDRCVFAFSASRNSIRGVLLLDDASGNTIAAAEAR